MHRPPRVSRELLSAFTVLLVATVGAAPLRGQADASFEGFQFNRSLPGARSLALGGAFVALADDATAAYSNPAGLTILESPEVSIEGRSWNTTTIFTTAGDARNGSDFRSFDFGKAKDYTAGLSFLSYVYSQRDARWAVALYRHQLIDFHSHFSSFGVRKDETMFFGPLQFSTDLGIVNYGLSGSYRIGRDLRLGVGLSYDTFDLESRQLDQKPNGTLIAGDHGHDSNVTFNLGALWAANPELTLGASYKRGPRFKMDECFPTSPGNPCFQGLAQGRGGFQVTDSFHAPDQFAFGIAFLPNDVLTALVEYDRVQYSQLLDGNRLGAFDVGGHTYKFDLNDANEVRLGVEYQFKRPNGEAFTIMGGGWYDPDHTLTFNAASFDSAPAGESLRFRGAYFQPTGKNLIHVSAGAEVAVERFQLDVGIDHSERADTLAISAVIHFR
ncbi:MAG TPA: outer membrane protein transport protein [Thermoanaerobaculia bacterium]|jgi:long-subunit fatty acid transport protein|nr:outer membrane protein transport protein [Thermoanaerobaculia bacterium]